MISLNIKIMKREKKKEEIKRKKKKKENSTELPKPNIVTEVYNNNKNMLLRANKAQKLS